MTHFSYIKIKLVKCLLLLKQKHMVTITYGFNDVIDIRHIVSSYFS